MTPADDVRGQASALAALAWPDVLPGRAGGRAPALLLVPLGATEQHGLHLPLDTDTVVAEAVCARVAAALAAGPGVGAGSEPSPRVLVAPCVAIGASGEHQDFPGTVSIGTELLTAVCVELVRSATTWADRVLLVNGNGGNLAAVTAATTQLRAEGRDVAWAPAQPGGGDLHAGRTETALLLHLAPDRVRAERAERGNTTPLTDLLPLLRRDGVRAHAPNGVLGDPAGASATEGEQLLAAVVAGLVAAIGRWQVGGRGRLEP